MIVLVDADTGVIAAIRATSWPEQFATAVRGAIARQLSAAGPDDGAATIDEWYRRFPSTADAVAAADIVASGGPGGAVLATSPQFRAGRQHATDTARSPQELLTTLFGPQTASTYHQDLPPELAAWHIYLPDAGHSIVAVVACVVSKDPDVDRDQLLVPVPVRTVLRAGWQLRDGYVVVDVPYDSELGLVTPDEDGEFD